MILLATALAILLILDGRRWSRLRLTEMGIEHESLDPMVRWSELVAVSYDRTWLRLQDQMGRTASVQLLYTSSPNAVLAAVREHTPPGVPIAVPPWRRDPAPPSPSRPAGVEPDDAFTRTYRIMAALFYMIPLWFGLAFVERPERYATLLATLFVIHLCAIYATGIALHLWPCPHCGKPYLGGWNARRGGTGYQRSKWPCANCGVLW